MLYIVQKGENLSAIARRHGLKLSQLLAYNPQILNPNLIYPGQQIIVGMEGNASGQMSAADATYYTVQRGDCLSRIAMYFRQTLDTLRTWNPSVFLQKYIYSGQKIRVK